ncbi:MAG TPA: nitroreductase/quinone reductase family protein [Acidimicrobiia bacterium]
MPPPLLEQLDYRQTTPGLARTSIMRILAGSGLTPFNRNVAEPIDLLTSRLSSRRTTLTTILTGLPVVFLTTTGARTGAMRTSPLVGIPTEGSLGLIGSNFGHSRQPGWVHNLLAQPRASITYRDTTVDVVARTADVDQQQRIWSTAIQMYPGYAAYRERAGERTIHLFVASSA